MENKSNVSKFISRQAARMTENAKRMRIILIVCAVLGIISMIFALSAVDRRVNPVRRESSPKTESSSPVPQSGIVVEGNFVFSLENETLTLTIYNGSDSVVEIPMFVEGYAVRHIGSSAFKGNRKISSVVIPNSVSSIGNNAFSGCTSLIDVSMSLGLTTIGDSAFANCRMLRAVTLPSNFSTGSSNAFSGCADNFTLHVFKDSAGESYAADNGYAYDYAAEEIIG